MLSAERLGTRPVSRVTAPRATPTATRPLEGRKTRVPLRGEAETRCLGRDHRTRTHGCMHGAGRAVNASPNHVVAGTLHEPLGATQHAELPHASPHET